MTDQETIRDRPTTTPMSKAELRKFGLTVGAAFLVLAIVSWARGHTAAPRVLVALGTALAVPALVAPAILAPVQRVWMRIALVLGHWNTRLILSVVYYLVVTPIGFVLRRFRDPLDRSLDDETRTGWIKRQPEPVDLQRYERQF